MIGRDRAENGQEWWQKSDQNSTKTGKTAGKKVLNVAKYLSFYHCYLILCDVRSIVDNVCPQLVKCPLVRV